MISHQYSVCVIERMAVAKRANAHTFAHRMLNVWIIVEKMDVETENLIATKKQRATKTGNYTLAHKRMKRLNTLLNMVGKQRSSSRRTHNNHSVDSNEKKTALLRQRMRQNKN